MILIMNMDMPANCGDCFMRMRCKTYKDWLSTKNLKFAKPNENCSLKKIYPKTVIVRTGHTTWEKRTVYIDADPGAVPPHGPKQYSFDDFT